eukprot:TRINITY_DN6900_c0_g1_i1.p1 TRINITY_DN6900_c0_g1~~TRINITY_DN6900_c0_g1_i1.p1  ORF type:complete len:670 (+),score=93.49 TRINITY_DN6900_c0_g1_i1:43-2052(+)
MPEPNPADGTAMETPIVQQASSPRPKAVGGLDMYFLLHAGRIARAMGPRLICAASGLCALQIGLAALYAYAYNLYAVLSGPFVEAITEHDRSKFRTQLIRMLLSVVLGAATNAAQLAIGELITGHYWRLRLSEVLQEKYLSYKTYYLVVHADSRIDNPDQRIAQDVQTFCQKLQLLLFGAPTFNGIVPCAATIIWFSVSLQELTGWWGPLVCFLYFIVSTIINKFLIAPVGRAVNVQAATQGDFRFAHTYLRAHVEHVAFLEGADREHAKLSTLLAITLAKFRRAVMWRFPLNTSSMAFYWGSGLMSYLIPGVAWWAFDVTSVTDVDSFVSISSVAVNLLYVYSYIILLAQEFSEVVGITGRIGEFIQVLDELIQQERDSSSEQGVRLKTDSETLKFEGVSVRTPDGRQLIEPVTFEVRRGSTVLIMGPSGCGKSSFLRQLGGLWPIHDGRVERPKLGPAGMMFMPQRPYLTLGTLQEQVAYPGSGAELTAGEIHRILSLVDLAYLCDQYLDGVPRLWSEILSGGEQQRLGLARVFYHKPTYVALDECTSAIDEDTEHKIYSELVHQGIAFLSVAHRSTVKKFHNYLLKITRTGEAVITPISALADDACTADELVELREMDHAEMLAEDVLDVQQTRPSPRNSQQPEIPHDLFPLRVPSSGLLRQRSTS